MSCSCYYYYRTAVVYNPGICAFQPICLNEPEGHHQSLLKTPSEFTWSRSSSIRHPPTTCHRHAIIATLYLMFVSNSTYFFLNFCELVDEGRKLHVTTLIGKPVFYSVNRRGGTMNLRNTITRGSPGPKSARDRRQGSFASVSCSRL